MEVIDISTTDKNASDEFRDRSERIRASQNQKARLLKLCALHFDTLFNRVGKRGQKQKIWKEIATELNSISGGCKKSIHQWRRCFQDLTRSLRKTVPEYTNRGPRNKILTREDLTIFQVFDVDFQDTSRESFFSTVEEDVIEIQSEDNSAHPEFVSIAAPNNKAGPSPGLKETNLSNLSRDHTCRLCLQENISLISIFKPRTDCQKDDYPEAKTPAEMLSSLINREIKEDVHVPDSVCISCCTSLQKCYDAVKNMQTTENLWMDHVKGSDKDEMESKSAEDCLMEEDRGYFYSVSFIDEESTRDTEETPTKDTEIVQIHEETEDRDSSNLRTNSTVLYGGLERKRIWATDFCSPNGPKQISCKICHMDFGKIRYLKEHLTTHASEDYPELLESDVLPGTASKYYNIVNAMGYEMDVNDSETDSDSGDESHSLYTCDLCKKRFDRKFKMYRHQANEHLWKDLPAKCERCNLRLSSSVLMQHHYRTFCHNPEKKIFCKICAIPFSSRENCLNHFQKIHVERDETIKDKSRERFECDICSKTFVTRFYLMQHQRTHSMGRKRILCSTCGKSFNAPNEINCHNPDGSVKKPNNLCSMCGRTFSTVSNLNVHMRRHNNVLPFECDQCDKAFVEADCLKTHKQLHLDPEDREKHNCNICGNYYSSIRTLRKHSKKMHNVQS